MKILGIESSCDETAAAVVEDGRTIISNGGKMENEIVNGTGRNEDSIIQRFWIDL